MQGLRRGGCLPSPPPQHTRLCSRHLGKPPEARTAGPPATQQTCRASSACPDLTVPFGGSPAPQRTGGGAVRWRAARHGGEKSVQGAWGLSGPAVHSPGARWGSCLLREAPRSQPHPSPALVPVPASHCWTPPLRCADKKPSYLCGAHPTPTPCPGCSCGSAGRDRDRGGDEWVGKGDGEERGGDEDPQLEAAVVPFGLNSGWVLGNRSPLTEKELGAGDTGRQAQPLAAPQCPRL